MRKRYLAPFVLSALFFAACGGGQSGSSEQKQSGSADAGHESGSVDSSMVAPGAAAAASSKGATLMEQKDCKTCHKPDVKLVGPSFKEIAQKYEDNAANEDMLADKIIKGGSGNWGEVAMLPHPDIPKDDAKEMVKYILSLK